MQKETRSTRSTGIFSEDFWFRFFSRTPLVVEISTMKVFCCRWELGVGEGEEICSILPFYANADLLHQVSTDKGCYVGQELTARTSTQGILVGSSLSIHDRFTGVLRRRILPFTCEGSVEKREVTTGEGKKVSRAFSAGFHTVQIIRSSKIFASYSISQVGKVLGSGGGRGLAILPITYASSQSSLFVGESTIRPFLPPLMKDVNDLSKVYV